MKRRAWVVGVSVVLVALVGSGFVWYKGRSSKPTLQNLATAQVANGSVVVTVSDTGSISGNLQLDVRPEVAGIISSVQTDLGEQVKKGDVLAVLSAPDVLDAATQAQLDLRSAQAKLNEMVHPSSRASQSDIDQAKARLALSEATRNSRNADLEGLTVKAPVSGTVVSLHYNQGDQAGSGSVFATISDMDHLSFVMSVTATAVPNVLVGQTANVVIGPGNESRTGTITNVDQAGYISNGQTLYDVTVSLDGGFSQDVRPGMSGYAILDTFGHGGDRQVEGKGTVQSGQSLDLHLSVSGTVSKLYIRQGSAVKAGDTLADLSNDQTLVAARQAELDYENALGNLNDLTNPPVTASQADIEAQQVRVQELQLSTAARQRDVDSLTIRAPMDGVVTARRANVGDKVSASGSAAGLFAVADYSKMQVTMNVDELDVGKVQVGQQGRVTIDALPGKSYTAQVVSVAPSGTQAQGVATFPVVLSLANPGDVKAGMTANVEIMITRKDNTLVVPLEAVQRRDGSSVVRRLVNGQVVVTPVETGLANDMVIEITSGLRAGDVVVTGATSSQQAGLRGLFMGGGGNLRESGGAGSSRPSGGRPGGSTRTGK
ncbi:MAG: efflux RND transporter periplasmic adaptor subunit [Symbiobacteriia bacterium]